MMSNNSLVRRLQKRGNSHALVIDKVLMEHLGISPETLLQLTITGGSLVVTPLSIGAGKQKISEAIALMRSEPGYSEMLANLAK